MPIAAPPCRNFKTVLSLKITLVHRDVFRLEPKGAVYRYSLSLSLYIYAGCKKTAKKQVIFNIILRNSFILQSSTISYFSYLFFVVIFKFFKYVYRQLKQSHLSPNIEMLCQMLVGLL